MPCNLLRRYFLRNILSFLVQIKCIYIQSYAMMNEIYIYNLNIYILYMYIHIFFNGELNGFLKKSQLNN